MKLQQLINLLSGLGEGIDDDPEVKVRVSIVIPDEAIDASEEDQTATDGDILSIEDERSVIVAYGEIHIIADKLWEE